MSVGEEMYRRGVEGVDDTSARVRVSDGRGEERQEKGEAIDNEVKKRRKEEMRRGKGKQVGINALYVLFFFFTLLVCFSKKVKVRAPLHGSNSHFVS